MESIHSLLYRHAIGQCSPEETARLKEWAGDDKSRLALLERLSDPSFVSRQLERCSLVSTERPMADMRRRISSVRNRQLFRTLSVAATIAILVGIISFIFLHNTGNALHQPATYIAENADDHSTPISLEEIIPGSTRARLVSATGESLNLSAADTSSLSKQILMTHNQTVERSRQLCLDVPRGGEFKIILEDSSEVWLNSESTLRYPEAFSQTERRVHITGEAYFAVRTDSLRPFIVETDEQLIRVYGTTFNVRAYPNDPCVYTTLESGTVSITRQDIHAGELMLSPGHQALFSRLDKKLNLRTVDPKVITGWRHGRFVFEEQPLSSIMRDLSRWYDFHYEFTDPKLEQIVFMGSIPRYADFTTAISIIEKSGNIRFSTDGDRVIISPR